MVQRLFVVAAIVVIGNFTFLATMRHVVAKNAVNQGKGVTVRVE